MQPFFGDEMVAFNSAHKPLAISNTLAVLKRLLLRGLGIAFYTRPGFAEELNNGKPVAVPLEEERLSALRLCLIGPLRAHPDGGSKGHGRASSAGAGPLHERSGPGPRAVTGTLLVGRLLAAPGKAPAMHDDDQDYFRNLRVARRLHDGTGLEPALPPGRLFDAACRHDFRCIDGSDDYGAIAPRRRADLVVLDYAALCEDFLTSEHDEVEVLLTRATSRHVRDLVVAGRQIVDDGVLTGLDLPDAEREFMDRARWIAASDAGQWARYRRRCESVRACYAGGHHLDGRGFQ